MTLTVRTPAKVNLFLKVLSLRPDGYHNIFSLMQMISLYDVLFFQEARKGIALTVRGDGIPGGKENIVWHAAEAIVRKAGGTRGVRITVQKNIPVSAGLGGGSSDAAATMWGLNTLWHLGYTRRDMMTIGEEVGSDVPFFFNGPTAIVAGRGEVVRPLRSLGEWWIVLVTPPVTVSTAWAYTHLGPASPSSSAHAVGLTNDLEAVTSKRWPVVEEIKSALLSSGAFAAVMSGSGPSVFGLYHERSRAGKAAGLLQGRKGWRAWLVKPLTKSPLG